MATSGRGRLAPWSVTRHYPLENETARLTLLRFAADVDIHSGNTQLTGIGVWFWKKVIVRDMNGQLLQNTEANCKLAMACKQYST